MDIAFYISDLLGQQGELSVPDLGYFVQTQMSAYYDEKTKKFFPPHYAVQFDPQAIDDDETLASYISVLKKISLASAKYFIEKYTTNLKDQVVIADVPFANMGTFSSDGVKLVFESGVKTDDPEFFAFAPIEVYKIGQEAPVKPIPQAVDIVENTVEQPPAEPVNTFTPTQPIAAPAEEYPVRTSDTETEVEYEYEEEPPRTMSVWIIILIVLTVIAIALVAAYKFKPELFKGIIPVKKDTTVVTKPAPVKKDTIAAQASVIPDSAAATKPDTVKIEKPATTTPVVTTPVKETTPGTTPVTGTDPNASATTSTDDAIAKGQWVIRAGTFPDRLPAEKRIDQLKGKGFTQARLEKAEVRRGNNYKVILGGGYATRPLAKSAMEDLVATGKIRSTEIFVEQIK